MVTASPLKLENGILHLVVLESTSEGFHQRHFQPICPLCKRIQIDDGCWEGLEVVLKKNPRADLTHKLCTECRSLYLGHGDRLP